MAKTPRTNLVVIADCAKIDYHTAWVLYNIHYCTWRYSELFKKTGFHCNKSRRCAYIIYRVKTWFKKKKR